MNDAHEFLKTLTLVLGVAAVTSVLFQRLRQPVVLGYLIAGLLVGPHVAFPLFADPATIQTLSELGVILLMFALGLDFRLAKLVALAPTAGLTALIQCSFMIWLGFVLGRGFGWTPLESIFTGALLAISSTTIIAKAFDEQRVTGRLREFVVGVLIVEDLIAVLLMAALTAASTGRELSAGELGFTLARLLGFLVTLVVAGLVIVPRAVRATLRLGRPETTLVACIGLCFGIALLAQSFGYSVALGAFIAGSLVAESGGEKQIEPLVEPVKDVFAAIFFVSVGMLIDPKLVASYWLPIAALTLAVIAGKVFGVSVGAFLTGSGTRVAIRSGMSLAQIGEFSFIIAGLGLSLRATGEFLYPVAVAVSALTTLTTPWLIRASGPFASFVDRKLPRRLQAFVSLYAGWIERLRESPRRDTVGAVARRLLMLLLLDAAVVAALVIGSSLAIGRLAPGVAERVGISAGGAAALIAGAALLLCVPFVVGIARLARRLGGVLAQAVFAPRVEGRPDFAAAPRRALLVSLELVIALLVTLPILAVTQPFVGRFSTGYLVLLLLGALGLAFWRTARDLEGHVRASAQAIAEALAAQGSRGAVAGHALEQFDDLLPGFGNLSPLRIEAASPAVGRTLAELDLRGTTGATVLAIQRGGASLSVPSAREVLRSGDVLAITGSEEAVEAARLLLAPAAAGNARPD
jgi:CPA2 family monovalent cation:H+ antiporter-2